ncbi:MAG: GreA/GreB family elongation factor, partial [Planctomycetota bacterium]|nr:GreA/GreB family elongation factor [Planctomycetota bacterium]
GGIDYRIRYLQKRLPTLKVVNQNPGDDRVRFGAWITVERDDGSTSEYRIVGADEIDHHEAYISVDAPVARALLGKYVDDEVNIQLDNKAHTLVVLTIEYR